MCKLEGMCFGACAGCSPRLESLGTGVFAVECSKRRGNATMELVLRLEIGVHRWAYRNHSSLFNRFSYTLHLIRLSCMCDIYA